MDITDPHSPHPHLPITVRPLTVIQNYPEELETLYNFWNTGWTTKIEDHETPKDLINHYINTGYAANFVTIYYEGQIAGFLGVVPAENEYNTGNDYETIIFIHPNFQRKNISRTINHSLAKAARGKGINLWAYVRENNPISIQVHKKRSPKHNPVPSKAKLIN